MAVYLSSVRVRLEETLTLSSSFRESEWVRMEVGLGTSSFFLSLSCLF